ncbi:HAMP domain-containing sensor histidine kinase [Propionicimonas sp.]|uniref:sensor histidine kinase n=1 Tax=Propionicimonas sp. TaxID=1955623 RepID=UPI0017FFFBF0|nr:HAMP domain-containing sensor histidine kinase [Propionicimonas sp.]MBU3976668.1 HAMP domain-containing histidine kinase [Actinomycetota bacterium]MBA3019734.1 HAMP domain-containing histidine kinase [Propionicimonas sp.]MBU3986763.1 HAMP domain-containing histidine kinase [Actinomycetota bacterium]MBU4006675.1 HAMP domain-containing histidine kinase [Actinomycetota bacterium]MBU4065375.1 HAMP domain-containing histidine kinase [Actinomycetota bacterium]
MIRWLRSVLSVTNRPLHDRLMALISVAVASAVAITGIAAYLITTFAIYDQLDRELLAVADVTSVWIAGDAESLGGLNSEALSTANVTMMLVRSDGRVITPSGDGVKLESTSAELAIARTQIGTSSRTGVASNGETYRIVAVPFADLRAGEEEPVYYALVMGRPLGPTDQILRILAFSLLTFGLLAVLLAGAIGWVIARSGLRPIQRLTEAVSRVTETDQLEPIEPGGMDELTDLTGAFNTMMRSLYSSRERQRRLIADAGHELRTPLTSLRTNVELLIADDRQGMLPEGARGEILRDIAAQLGEFTQLIGDLVHLSRDDKVEAHPEPIDLRDVLNNAVTRAKRRGPALIFDVEMEPLYLVGEPDSLERAFTNLLDNAVKFSPPGGRIKVRLIGDRVRISDEGPGIADADLPHVFDRFYRSDHARTTPGSGLGLSIVAQTIKAHGGWVKAGRAGTGGAEFTVRLPGSADPLDNSSETTGTIPAVTD